MCIATEKERITASPSETAGSASLFAQITPRVYADLRRLAHGFMRRERASHTLQPTAVVNEAFLRLSNSNVRANDAPHLYRLVARTMRRVLVDHARERHRAKHNAAWAEQALRTATTPCPPPHSQALLDVLDIDAALDQLAEKSRRAAELVELRYFAGLEDLEIGELYGMSRPTVEREFRFAKAFLIAYAMRQRTALDNALGPAPLWAYAAEES